MNVDAVFASVVVVVVVVSFEPMLLVGLAVVVTKMFVAVAVVMLPLLPQLPKYTCFVVAVVASIVDTVGVDADVDSDDDDDGCCCYCYDIYWKIDAEILLDLKQLYQ